MIALTAAEATLFRLLAGVFGSDRVVPQMRIIAVCGGALPAGIVWSEHKTTELEMATWAQKNRALFTIVDSDDDPRLVVEFSSGFEDTIDPIEEEHERLLRPLLTRLGVTYVTMSEVEFAELIDPESKMDLVAFLSSKLPADSVAFLSAE